MSLRLLALAGLLALSACGIRGDLSPAPPMWGEAREEYRAKQAAGEATPAPGDADAAAEAEAADETDPETP